MKRFPMYLALFITLVIAPSRVLAQGMMGSTNSPLQAESQSDDHTAREEAAGQAIWAKLQTKEVTCETLADAEFAALGEYYMGQMMGAAHPTMNNRLTQMLGEAGETQMHVALGKRLSGCDPNAPMPQNMLRGGMMPMMNMMLGTPRMDVDGFGFLGWLPILLFWILLILGVIALIRYLGGATKDGIKGKSPLDILKQRYAKGEINKQEFDKIKKELNP